MCEEVRVGCSEALLVIGSTILPEMIAIYFLLNITNLPVLLLKMTKELNNTDLCWDNFALSGVKAIVSVVYNAFLCNIIRILCSCLDCSSEFDFSCNHHCSHSNNMTFHTWKNRLWLSRCYLHPWFPNWLLFHVF